MSKETNKLLGGYVVIILLIVLGILIWGCNPVKKISKSPKLYEKARQLVVSRGGCIVDTTTKIRIKDSLIYKDTSYTGTVKTKLASTCNYDTTFPDGFHLVISDGVISYKLPVKIEEHQRTIIRDNYIVDHSRIDLLLSQLKTKSDSLSNLKLENRQQKQTIRELRFKFWGLLSLIAIGGIITIYLKIRKIL